MLLDLNMPEYDGFMVLNYFKNNNLFRKYPICIISGDDTKETISKAFSYDIVDMLNKPFSKTNVECIVEKMLSRKDWWCFVWWIRIDLMSILLYTLH